MNKIERARFLLSSLEMLDNEYEIMISNLDSDYEPTQDSFKKLDYEKNKIINIIIKEFSNDEFLKSIVYEEGKLSPFAQNYLTLYLKNYLETGKQNFICNLLDASNKLIEEGLYYCSALCLRLYLETVMRTSFEKDISFDTKDMFGDLFSKIIKAKMNLISEDIRKEFWNYSKRLNDIIHNNNACVENPPTEKEMDELVEKTIELEKYMIRLSDT